MKVLLVDDQTLFLKSLEIVISSIAPDMKIVGLAANGEEAVEKAKLLSPELILMDVRMPIMDGVEAVRRIHVLHPEIMIVMLTTFNDDTYVQKALDHGAVGYLLKDMPPAELIESLRAVKKVSIILSPNVAKKLALGKNRHMESKSVLSPQDEDLFTAIRTLSRRENEIFELLLQGFSNDQIEEKLFIAPQTVRNHISHIYSKLEVASRLELIRKLH